MFSSLNRVVAFLPLSYHTKSPPASSHLHIDPPHVMSGPLLPLVLAAVFFSATSVSGADRAQPMPQPPVKAAGSAGQPSLQPAEVEVAKRMIDAYCVKCHGPTEPMGEINLAGLVASPAAAETSQNRPTWKILAQQLRERHMPPDDARQPTADERGRLQSFAERAANFRSAAEPSDPGWVPIRRLNRAEYRNTMRDLLGVDLETVDQFPVDGAGGEGFDNHAETLYLSPALLERYLGAARAALERVRRRDELRARLFVARPGPSGHAPSPHEAAQRILMSLASRAFRRPVREEELRPFLTLFDSYYKKSVQSDAAADAQNRFEEAVSLMATGVLISPRFLFRTEEIRPTSEPYRVTDHELAVRLSYFLWSSMPDERLRRLADTQRLHESKILAAEVQRMIADKRSRALADNFAAQWFGLHDLDTVIQPNQRVYPDYSPQLADAMREELLLWFDSIVREDRSLLTLLDSDYTFVNAPLAKLYGIEGIVGDQMQRVAIVDPNRRGILGRAAVLTLTSYPARTSPVLRGRWVLTELLGARVPPPPADVSNLDRQPKAVRNLPLREQLALHRRDTRCASCHQQMDPIGFALENFDGIGRWRETQNGQRLDTSGVLPTGETFNGPQELRQILITSRRAAFVRNLVRKTLGYALGRGLTDADETSIDALVSRLEKNDLRASALLLAIAESYPMQFRRGDPTRTLRLDPHEEHVP